MGTEVKRDRRLRDATLHRDGPVCAARDGKFHPPGVMFPTAYVQHDHIVELREGGQDTLANSQILCVEHHREKTARTSRRLARRERRRNGTRRFGGTLLFLAAGAGLLRWEWLNYFHGHRAADRFVGQVLGWATVLGFALVAAVMLVVVWKTVRYVLARPPASPAAAEPTAAADPPPDRDAARIEASVREAVGRRGTVTVSGVTRDRARRLTGFTVTYAGTGLPDHDEERRVDLIDRFAAKLGGRWQADWRTDQDQVDVTRRPNLPTRVDHPGFTPGRPWHVIPVAPGIQFDLLVTSHLLILGATNAGKTATIRAIVCAFLASAATDDAQVWLADPKRIELLGFRDWPGVDRLATTDEDLSRLPCDARYEMDRRYTAHEADPEGYPLESFPPLLIVIDEYEEYVDRMTAAMFQSGTRKTGQKPEGPEAVKSLLRMARRCRIHLVIGTQRPDSSFFGGSARDNMQGRALVGRSTQESSRMAFGASGVGRDVPARVKGRATFQVGDEQPVEGQCYWVPDPKDARTLSPNDLAILGRVKS